MAVVAFVRPDPGPVPAPAYGVGADGAAESRLRVYGRAMRLCFLVVLALWGSLQIGCLLSLFLHFQAGIVAGIRDGTVAFKFWPMIEYFSPHYELKDGFSPHVFPLGVAIGYSLIMVIASVPFCASLLYLAKLFDLYSRREIFTQRTTSVMRRIGHSILATGYSPLLLGPFAHAIGVLKPVSGITEGMIAFVFVGLILLAISHVMEIGQRMRQDQEEIL